MDSTEYRNKSRSELRDEEHRLRKELFDLQFKHGTRQLSDTASIKRARREIARVKTISSELALSENS